MYSYRKHTITITKYGVVVHNTNGYLGQFATQRKRKSTLTPCLIIN